MTSAVDFNADESLGVLRLCQAWCDLQETIWSRIGTAEFVPNTSKFHAEVARHQADTTAVIGVSKLPCAACRTVLPTHLVVGNSQQLVNHYRCPRTMLSSLKPLHRQRYQLRQSSKLQPHHVLARQLSPQASLNKLAGVIDIKPLIAALVS